jgi:hypothetical protein
MNQINPLDKMVARDREIDAQIEALKAEKAKIHTALEVIREYSENEDSEPEPAAGRVPRPEGIPTLYEMVVNVLRPHDFAGGLTSTAIIDLIRSTYWPGVRSDQIGPSLYRFLKEKRLAKTGDRFHLAQSN